MTKSKRATSKITTVKAFNKAIIKLKETMLINELEFQQLMELRSNITERIIINE